jgi:integrase/recombinase XerD
MKTHEFEQFLTVRKGLQAITVHGYVGSARRFTRALGDYPTHEAIEKYVYVLFTSQYSYSHKHNTVIAIEYYTEFIGNPIHLGRQKKPRPIIKDTLTESEVTKLIFNCKNSREKAIVSLLAYSGIRNLELCNLKVKDFDPGRNTITVWKGKGMKDGVSHISSECTRLLIEYLQDYPRERNDFLFTTLQKNHQYHTGDTRKLVHILAHRAHLSKRVYPHLLRHSLAANMLLRGSNIVTLQRQLRHSMLETTLHYVNSIVFGERNEYDKFVPSYI